jgi:hypothetical protein
MKKFIVMLAVLLLASPAMAAVRISVEDEGGFTGAINYETDGEKVRAFALDIQVDAGTIEAISDYKVGESTSDAPGYGIFPANFSRYITVDAATGEVESWDVNDYTPVADVNDPGALGGLGTNGITIEMGALYYPPEDNSPNAPPNSGTLCKITVSQACNVTLEQNVTRGGVVLTDPAVAPTVESIPGSISGEVECFPSEYSTYNDWVALGKPDCWCSDYQCDGDIDGATSGFPFNYRIYNNDLSILVDNWQKKIDDPTLDPCADIDHKSSGFPFNYRVYNNDLSILVDNWTKKDADLAGDCPRAE